MTRQKEPNVQDVLNTLNGGKGKDYKIDLSKGILETDGPEDHARAMDALSLMSQARTQLASSAPGVDSGHAVQKKYTAKPFSESSSAYILDCVAVGNESRTIYAKRVHLETFGQWFGENRSMDEVDKQVLNDFIEHLRVTPPDKAKGGAVDKDAKGRSAKTIDNYFHTIRPFLEFCISRGHCNLKENPASSITIIKKSVRNKTAVKFDLFTDDELSKIFDPESYHGFMNQPDFFWIPLIAFYTGMRISEIGSLQIKDFVVDKGVDYIQVRESKTDAGIRSVPIHKTLIELGLLTYVAEVKAAGHQSIFPFRKAVPERIHKRAQERFAEYREKLGIKEVDGKKGAHSFRVGMITRLVEKQAQSVHIKRITGHSVDTSAGQAVHEGYVRKINTLHETINLFDSENFALNVQALKYEKGQFLPFLKSASKAKTK